MASKPKELPAKGWVTPGEIRYCDICGRRVYVWSLHHLVPMSWGGSDSRRITDHQVIWVRTCGDCHDTVHMVLDHCQKVGAWDDLWINSHGDLPHLVVEVARRGWNGWKQMTFGDTT
jgi:hypothetical protein